MKVQEQDGRYAGEAVLRRLAGNILSHLRERLAPGSRVAVRMGKGVHYVAALRACWEGGFPFVPMEDNFPEGRAEVNFTLDRAGAETMAASGPGGGAAVGDLPLGNAVLYRIYSSGSTGAPKGIDVTGGGIAALARAQAEAFGITSRSRLLWVLNNAFDGSLSDFFTAAFADATLVVPSAPCYHRLWETADALDATHANIPPSVLKCCRGDIPACLESIACGGEALDAECVNRFGGAVRLVNAYGPTEATVCSSMARLRPGDDPSYIGEPVEDVLYAVDTPEGIVPHPCARDCEGELLIGGTCLAAGYTDPALTERRFPMVDGIRRFRTGDLVRSIGGRLHFVTRIDRQFKYHGQLVAPEEVEAAYGRAQRVHLTRDMTLWVEGGAAPDEPAGLPDYLRPRRFRHLDRLPETATGKVDGPALERMAAEDSAERMDFKGGAAPGDPRTEAVLDALERALGRRPAPDEPIEELDNSIDCLAAAMELESAGLRCDPPDVARGGTAAGIAALLDGDGATPAADEIDIARRAAPPKTTLFIGGTGFLGSRLLHLLLADPSAKGRRHAALVRGKRPLPDGVEPLYGDATLPMLGLDAQTYLSLVDSVDEIIVASGLVNAAAPYAELLKANAAPVREAALLARRSGAFLHAASTLSVAVCSDYPDGTVPEGPLPGALDMLRPYRVRGAYARAKLAAEAEAAGVPCNLYRYGLLTADTRTLESPVNNLLGMFCRETAERGVPAIPDPDRLLVDLTPVDLAAAATARAVLAARRGGAALGALNVTCNAPLSARELLVLVERVKGSPVREVPRAESPVAAGALCRAFGTHSSLDLFESTGRDYATGGAAPDPYPEDYPLRMVAAELARTPQKIREPR